MIDGPDISDAEWKVMREVWKIQGAFTSSQIIDQLEDHSDWSPGTVKTLLHRLVQKGILDFQRKGNRYIYRSLYSESDCVDHFSNQMLYTVFGGRPIPMIECLVKSSRLSGKELETLQTLLRDLQEQLPPNRPRESRDRVA